MRHLPALLTILSLSVFSAGAVLAQTAAKPPSNREQLRIDSDECAKQVDRHRVDLFADCMNKKQAARKEAAKRKKGKKQPSAGSSAQSVSTPLCRRTVTPICSGSRRKMPPAPSVTTARSRRRSRSFTS